MNPAERVDDAAEYVRQITGSESDRRYRRSFQLLALQLAPPGCRVFDFGSGPGIDARFYAEHGRRVVTYDIDAAMCEYQASHCRDLITRGALTIRSGPYREFLEGTAPQETLSAALITANFAPLNLIDNLPELFARFAALTNADGVVLASVLSPCFVADLRYPWWWRNAARLLREGRYAVAGARGPIWRRSAADFSAQCSPYFFLAQLFTGDRAHARPTSAAARLHLLGCRYMFLLFRKRPANSPWITAQPQPPAASSS